MLGGPGLLVIAGIALLVFGPKKLPELAKTIGRALGEFKQAAEEMKESVGINELRGMRSKLTGVDLISDIAEKLSAPTNSEEKTGETLAQGGDNTRPIIQNKEEKR